MIVRISPNCAASCLLDEQRRWPLSAGLSERQEARRQTHREGLSQSVKRRMIRPRSTTPLHRLAGEGIRSTLRGKKRITPAVVSSNTAAAAPLTGTRAVVSMHTGAVSTHDNGNNSTRRVGSRIRSSGRWLDTSLPSAQQKQQQQQRWRSCCFAGDNSRAATGGAGSATTAAAATAAASRTTSTSAASGMQKRKPAQESSTVGTETANGITFETGKVSLLCYRSQQHTRASLGLVRTCGMLLR